MPPPSSDPLAVAVVITLAYFCAGGVSLLAEQHQLRLTGRLPSQTRCDSCEDLLTAWMEFRAQMSHLPRISRGVVHIGRLLLWPFGITDQIIHMPPLHRCARSS